MRIFFIIAISFLVANPAWTQSQEATYLDATESLEERVDDLISRMTLEEKIGQMTQLNISLINTTGEQRDVELDSEKALMYIREHKIGSFLNGEAVPAQEWFSYINELQKIAIEESRLGIPIIYGIDHIHGASYLHNATIFPHNINLAASFNPEHAYNSGDVTVIESGDLGHNWNFAPVLDLGRNPKWARFYETFGESYHLASELGDQYVLGIQEHKEENEYVVAATGKHFLGYSVPSSGWDRTPAEISTQNLHEFHLPPFKSAIDQGLLTIMVNSSEINGVPVHASYELLTELLREELGFEGVVVTDWDDIGKLVTYHYTAENYKEAVYQSVIAGIDMSMTPLHLDFNKYLIELVNEGRISEERINASVRRILTLKFKTGLFDNPYPSDQRFDRIRTEESVQKSLQAARESIVLLKNEQTLPLNSFDGKILVAGPVADSKRYLSGGWTIAWQGGEEERYPDHVETIYTALQKAYPEADVAMPSNWKDFEEVRELSKDADFVIAAIGEQPYTEFVGNITDLNLPADQVQMVKALADSDKPVVGIFVGGRPRIVHDIINDLDAYLWAGLPGFEGGEAITDILTGNYNPSARLPYSYPKYPSHFVPYNHKPSDVYFFNPEEANDINQTESSVWEWPFGYGLSYTTYEFSNLTISSDQLSPAGDITASVKVSNTGNIAGKVPVLWFLRDEVGTITRPVKELKYFSLEDLKPGESRDVSFTISPGQHLAYPNQDGNLIIEEGYFTLTVDTLKTRFLLQNPEQAQN